VRRHTVRVSSLIIGASDRSKWRALPDTFAARR
jgi:hypothetical protein